MADPTLGLARAAQDAVPGRRPGSISPGRSPRRLRTVAGWMTTFPARTCLDGLRPRAACGGGNRSRKPVGVAPRGVLAGKSGPRVPPYGVYGQSACSPGDAAALSREVECPDQCAGRSRASPIPEQASARAACSRADREFTATSLGRTRKTPEFRSLSSSARSGSNPVAFGCALAGSLRIRRFVGRPLSGKIEKTGT